MKSVVKFKEQSTQLLAGQESSRAASGRNRLPFAGEKEREREKERIPPNYLFNRLKILYPRLMTFFSCSLLVIDKLRLIYPSYFCEYFQRCFIMGLRRITVYKLMYVYILRIIFPMQEEIVLDNELW